MLYSYSSAQQGYRHFFEDGIARRLFKCRIELAGHPISGILLVKRVGDFSLRAVYTAETGFTFFDIAMADGTASFYTVVGPFKRKIIQRALADVLQSALLRPLDCAFEHHRQSVWTCSQLRYDLKIDQTGEEFPRRVEMFRGKRLQSSADFYFLASRKQLPDSIYAVRDGFPLKMSFRTLNQ
jgi:hypothetical protein